MSKSEKRKKSSLVMLRIAPDDRSALEQKAADVRRKLPGYLIECGLGRKTRSAMEDHIIQELRSLGEQQRQLFQKSGGQFNVEYNAVLAELIAAIKRIGA
jgi:hypothetical protein